MQHPLLLLDKNTETPRYMPGPSIAQLALPAHAGRSKMSRAALAALRLVTAGQTVRSTIIFLISAIALAGFSPFGQVFAQFMIVWHR